MFRLESPIAVAGGVCYFGYGCKLSSGFCNSRLAPLSADLVPVRLA